MTDELIEYLSGFVKQRRLDSFDRVLQSRTRYINVVCEDIYQRHNASAILRTCDCFGIQDIHVYEDKNSFEVNSEVALGASSWLSIYHHKKDNGDIGVLFSDLKSAGYRIVAATPHVNGCSLKDFDIEKSPVSLVFGTEKDGLSDNVIKHADESVSIDMYGFTESFNVSVSAGIILHFLRNKLLNSQINWQLKDREKKDIKLDWLRKTIKRSDLIESDFKRKNYTKY
jgi:tRNA (guanosine-2'-O-)-methyltransferase